MGFLRTLLHYAQTAWGALAGAVTDPAAALRALWTFTGSLHNLVDNLFSSVGRKFDENHLSLTGSLLAIMGDYLAMVARIAHWIWGRQVNPVRVHLNTRIARLRRWTAGRLNALLALMLRLYMLSLIYAARLVNAERKERMAADRADRAYSVKLTKAALATVQRQASDGYNSDTSQRKSVIVTIADDLAARNPELKGLIGDVIKYALDLAEVEDPLLRIVLNYAINELVDKLGVDRVMGDLLTTLIRDLTGDSKPVTLESVEADTASRLTALEAQWADFMKHGGPEVEHEGDNWKEICGYVFEAAAVGFFAQALLYPQDWAREVNDTAGALVNETLKAVVQVIREA